jgi:hypothetical protein
MEPVAPLRRVLAEQVPELLDDSYHWNLRGRVPPEALAVKFRDCPRSINVDVGETVPAESGELTDTRMVALNAWAVGVPLLWSLYSTQ